MFLSEIAVSLLVRLWVEMYHANGNSSSIPSASLWGCELKYNYLKTGTLSFTVSLLVRLWVEMLSSIQNSPFKASASLWGCELKYSCLSEKHLQYGQPPCEAVSWNNMTGVNPLWLTCQPPCEAVSWNVHGKYRPHSAQSASLWGCELKYMRRVLTLTILSQPPCEAVSWNDSVVQ